MACGSSRTHRHRAQELHIWLLNWYPTSKRWWESTPTLHAPNQQTVQVLTATHPKTNTSYVHAIARNPNAPSRMADAENRRRTRTTSQRRIRCPSARSSKKLHQVKLDKCTRNKKYKNYHFKSICNKLEVAFKPCHKFSAELGWYASKSNKLGDKWRCAGRPEDKEKKNNKWIMVTGNGKTKNLLNPKPKPKLHNAFAILSQPNAPTYYDVLSPAQHMDNDRTIISPQPKRALQATKICLVPAHQTNTMAARRKWRSVPWQQHHSLWG